MQTAVLTDWMHYALQDRPMPVPKTGEVLLKVSLAGVCGSDVHIRNGTNPIAVTPVVQGHEFCGEVVALGNNTDKNIEIGMRAVVYPLVSCGECPACHVGTPHVCKKLVVIGVNRDGGYCEFISVPAQNVVPMPADIPAEIGVLSEPFSIGHHCLTRGRLGKGEDVLIIGAGPIGLYTAIVARARGAGKIVFSEPNIDRCKQAEDFGFIAVNPTDVDSANQLKKLTTGKGYEVVIETSGVQSGLVTAQEAAAISGRIVLLGFPSKRLLSYDITQAIVKEVEMLGSRVCPREEFFATLDVLTSLYRSNSVDFKRIIAEIFPLSQVSEAIEVTALGHKLGKVLIEPGRR